MLKKIIKYVFIISTIYLMICLATPYNENLRNRSIKNQISYIDKIMKKGYDNKLQRRFPEGKVFSNAIFSLKNGLAQREE